MLPDPSHPAVVHFPIVLAILMPMVAALFLWKTRGVEKPRKIWAWVVVYAGVTLLSARVATGTGSAQEDRVEDVVAENVIHEHEEKAELLLVLSAIVLLSGAVGLAPGRIGGGARAVTLAVAVTLASQAVWVGKSGGELVYVHGAAGAYAGRQSAVPGSERTEAAGVRSDRDRHARDGEDD